MEEIIKKLKKMHPDLVAIQIDCRDLKIDLVFPNNTFMGESEFLGNSSTKALLLALDKLFYPEYWKD